MTTPCKNSKSTCCLLASFAMTIFRLLGKQLITVLAACLQSIDTSSSMCFKVSSFNSCFSPSAYPVLCKMLSMKLNEWYCKQKRILWLFKKNPLSSQKAILKNILKNEKIDYLYKEKNNQGEWIFEQDHDLEKWYNSYSSCWIFDVAKQNHMVLSSFFIHIFTHSITEIQEKCFHQKEKKKLYQISQKVGLFP